MTVHIDDSALHDYLHAPPGSAARENAAAAIAAAAAPVIRAAMSDHGTVVNLSADGTREELMADATMAVLDMVARYNPALGVSFGVWVSAKAAPWRRTLEERTKAANFARVSNRADRRVLATYEGVARAYENEHGHPPNPADRDALLAEAVAERSAAAGETPAQLAARNTRSGYRAAAKRLTSLLDAKGTSSLDAADDEHRDKYAVLAAPRDPRLDELEAEDTLAAWRRLAGPAPDAANRMRCPHAQWLHLAPAAALTTYPSPV